MCGRNRRRRKEAPIRRHLFALSLLCGFAVPALADGSAQATPIEELKRAGREIGHATRDTARKAGHATREAAQQTGHAARAGANDVKNAVTGDDKPADPAR